MVVHIGALFALEEAAPQVSPAIVVPVLVERLTDTNAVVRSLAVFTLGKYGSAANAAIPGLLKTLNDPDARVRLDAAMALKQIDPEAAP